MSALSDMVQAAIDAGQRIREIIREPDGTLRVLTEDRKAAPIDDLTEARERRRAGKGIGNVDGHQEAG